MAFEKYILPDTSAGEKKMASHLFIAILAEYLQGNKSGAEAKTAIEDYVGNSLTTDESTDITNIIAYLNAGADATAKRARLDEVYRVIILAEHKTWYGTQELLKTRLNFI